MDGCPTIDRRCSDTPCSCGEEAEEGHSDNDPCNLAKRGFSAVTLAFYARPSGPCTGSARLHFHESAIAQPTGRCVRVRACVWFVSLGARALASAACLLGRISNQGCMATAPGVQLGKSLLPACRRCSRVRCRHALRQRQPRRQSSNRKACAPTAAPCPLYADWPLYAV